MPTPTLVQHTASASGVVGGGGGDGSVFTINLPNSTLLHNCLILGISYDNAVSLSSISDNLNGTWPAATATVVDAGPTVKTSVFVLPNTAAGKLTLTVTFSITVDFFQYTISEFCNVATASPVDGGSGVGFITRSAAAAANSINTGALSTATDGDLIWAYYANTFLPFAAIPTDMVPGGSFSLLDASIGTNGSQLAHASEYFVQTTHGSITPSLTLTGGGTDVWNGIAIALKSASAGSPRSGIYINSLIHETSDAVPAAADWIVKLPCSGNVIFVRDFMAATSVTDSAGNTYTRCVGAGAAGLEAWYAWNVTPSNSLKITLHAAGGSGARALLYDISGADVSSDPLDSSAINLAPGNCPTTTLPFDLTDAPSLTPASVGLTIAMVDVGIGPEQSLANGAPATAVFDNVFFPGMADGDRMEFGDGAAHLFNTDLTTEHWNWRLNNPAGASSGSNYQFAAVHFKAFVPTVFATGPEPRANFDTQLIVRAWFDDELSTEPTWFDVELGGLVIDHETKGAFSAELLVKGWFDEELIATRNWFDVELPTPQGSSVSLAGAISGAGAVAAQLTLAEALAAYVAGQAAPTATLSLAESLAGVLSGQATLTGKVGLAEALAGSIAGASTLTGSLVEAIALQGALAGTSTASGSLSEAVALQGTLAGDSALTGNLGTGSSVALAGSIAGASALTGSLAEAVALQGSLAGVSALTGLLSESVALQGVLAGDAALTGNLGIGSAPALAGAIAGASVLTGSLAEAIALQAALSGASTPSAALALAEALQGVVIGSSAVGAPLSLAEALQAIVAGSAASPSATLSIAVSLQGILSGSTSATGSLSTPGVAALAGIIAGASAASASMSETVALRGALAASASLAGLTSDLRSIAGVISGAGKSSGALSLGLQLSGAVQGAAAQTAGTLLEVVRLQGALASASALSALISAFDPNTVGPALAGRQDLTGLRGVADLNSLAGIQTLGSLKGKVT